MTNKTQQFHVLAIVAHPDDESFLLAGTSLKFAEEGKLVGIICATKGEKGADRLNRNLNSKQMAQIRIKELFQACSLLSCNCLECLDYPDGGLASADFSQLVNLLAEKINYFAPRIILTFGEEGISGHKDHITIGKAATAAAKQSKVRPLEIWLASMPASIMPEFHEHLNKRKVHHAHFQEQELKGVPDEKLLKIDIGKYAQTKHKALKAHQSQYLPQLTFGLFLRNECFEVIRLP